jgi:phage-related protein
VAALAEAFVAVRADFRGFGNEVRTGVGRSLDGPSRQMRDVFSRAGNDSGRAVAKGLGGGLSLARGAVAGLGAGLVAIGAKRVLGGLIGEAREAARVTRLTENVIRSTGGAANVTAGHVGDLAEKVSNYAAVDDEAVQAGANLLLTFKNIRNEVGRGNDIFNQATKAAADMSATFGQDLNASAVQLGKALDNPIKGVTALQRVGVSFTAQQKDQIKTLVESGRTLDAQKIILKELNSQVGGAAGAAADPMQRLGVIMDNLKERVGTALLPAISGAAAAMGKLAIAAGPVLGKAFRALGAVLRPIIRGVRIFFDALTGKSKLNEFSGGLKRANNAGIRLADFFRTKLMPTFRTIAEFVRNDLVPVLRGLADFFIQKILPPVKELAGVLMGALQNAFRSIGQAIERNRPQLEALLNALKGLASFLISVIVPVLKVAIPIAYGITTRAITTAITIVATFVRVVQGAASVTSTLAGVVAAGFRGVRGAVDAVVSSVAGLPGRIGALFGRVRAAFAGLGRAMLDGVASVLRGGAGFVGNIGKAVVNAIIQTVNTQVIDRINRLLDAVKIPVPGLPDIDLPNPNIPRIPMLAAGVRNFRGGYALLGERGAELVRLPRGADVHSAPETRRMLASNGPALGRLERLIEEQNRLLHRGQTLRLTDAGERVLAEIVDRQQGRRTDLLQRGG